MVKVVIISSQMTSSRMTSSLMTSSLVISTRIEVAAMRIFFMTKAVLTGFEQTISSFLAMIVVSTHFIEVDYY